MQQNKKLQKIKLVSICRKEAAARAEDNSMQHETLQLRPHQHCQEQKLKQKQEAII